MDTDRTERAKSKDDEWPEQELTEKILGAAFAILNTLGCGFLEKVYENALVVELSRAKIPVEQQKPLQISYEGVIVG